MKNFEYKEDKDKGFLVRIPFEIKDEFRKCFPSAKWQKSLGLWKVGSRSGKRLDDFVSKMQKPFLEIEQGYKALEVAELKEHEIRELEHVLNNMQKRLEQKRREKQNIEESNKVIAEVKELTEAVGKELSEQEKILEREREKVRQSLNKVGVSLDEVLNIRQQIIDIFAKVNNFAQKNQKDAYAKCYVRLEEIVIALKKANLQIEEIKDVLMDVNLNREDRDNPKRFPVENLYKITRA